jgi:inosose dehydratase
MTARIQWSYAINQWDIRMNVFVRHEEHARAFRTLSAVGFEAIELTSGTGRWANLGRPEIIELNHGSRDGFRKFLRDSGIKAVSSMFWDPGAPCEEEGWQFRNIANPADHEAIARSAASFASFIADVGGSTLVVRPAGSAWMMGKPDQDALANVAKGWTRVAEAIEHTGTRLALHFDCLCAIHDRAQIDALLGMLDPRLVGVAVDTAELTISGIEPAEFIRTHAAFVQHVQLKNTRYRDSGKQYMQHAAEQAMLHGDDERGIDRWFFELGVAGGLVDVPEVMRALDDIDYRGWVVVESDGGSDPAELVMLNGWYLKQKLGLPIRLVNQEPNS